MIKHLFSLVFPLLVVLCLVAQSCLTLLRPCQAPLSMGILEWIAMPSSRGSSNPGIELRSPTLQVDSSPCEPPGKSFPLLNSALLLIELTHQTFIQQTDIYWIPVILQALNLGSSIKGWTRHSCYSHKLHDIISWIPVILQALSLGSSIKGWTRHSCYSHKLRDIIRVTTF